MILILYYEDEQSKKSIFINNFGDSIEVSFHYSLIIVDNRKDDFPCKKYFGQRLK
jgi:hypothetical protein